MDKKTFHQVQIGSSLCGSNFYAVCGKINSVLVDKKVPNGKIQWLLVEKNRSNGDFYSSLDRCVVGVYASCVISLYGNVNADLYKRRFTFANVFVGASKV